MKDLTNYLGKTVMVEIERPMGSCHPEKNFIYLLNYGFIPDTVSGDDDPIDVYIVGFPKPMRVEQRVTCKVIAVIDREDDVEQKLVAVPIVAFPLYMFTAEQIMQLVSFRESAYKSRVIMGDQSVPYKL